MFSVRSLTMRGELGDELDRIVGERELDAFGCHQRDVLLDQRAARLGEDPHELRATERLELDANRKAALQLGNQIARLRHVKRAGGDEQDVVGAHHAVLGVDGGAFDDRQDVALDAFAAHVGSLAALAARDLVDLVEEDDACLLHAIDARRARPDPCRPASAVLPVRALPWRREPARAFSSSGPGRGPASCP